MISLWLICLVILLWWSTLSPVSSLPIWLMSKIKCSYFCCLQTLRNKRKWQKVTKLVGKAPTKTTKLKCEVEKKKRNSRFVVFFFVVISLGTDLVTNSWKELTIQSVCPLCDIQFLLFAKLSKIKVFLVENENGKVSKCAKHFSFLLRQINIIPVRCRGTRCIRCQAKSKTSWSHLKKNRHEN